MVQKTRYFSKIILTRCGSSQHTHTANEQTEAANALTTRSEKRQYIKLLQQKQEEQQEQPGTIVSPTTEHIQQTKRIA